MDRSVTLHEHAGGSVITYRARCAVLLERLPGAGHVHLFTSLTSGQSLSSTLTVVINTLTLALLI